MASAQTTQLLTALQNSSLQTTNPALYQVIRGLVLSIDSVSDDIITIQSALNPGGGSVPNDITGFMVDLQPTQIVFTWDSLGAGFSYEIREGSVWSTANYVTTTLANNAVVLPLVYGTYTYLIKGIDTTGTYSANATSVTFTITPIGPLSVTSQLVSNNILLSWTEPSSIFAIDHYNFYRNGTLIATCSGTFFVYFESQGGVITYAIQAVDVAGNTNTATGPTLTVPAPSDYLLQASLTDTGFTGMPKVNVFAELY